MDLRLFGEDFHTKFLETSRSPNFQEYDEFNDAIENQSIFQARHIHQLLKTTSPPACLLLHVDLRHVVHTLGYRAATQKDRKRIRNKTNIPTSAKERLDPEICNIMISSYLKNPFFSRFRRTLINIINIDQKKNSIQFQARTNRKLFSRQTIDQAKQAHDAMYDSWERNTYLLKPEKIFHTFVSAPGDLLLNNQCICKNWSQKNGFD